MNVRKLTAFLAITFCLFGCGAATIKTIPDSLVGVWTTDAPKYADRYFELKKDAVIFAVGDGKVTTSAVIQVKGSQEKTRTLYDISYLTQEGTTQKFSVYYEPATSMIRMKSQEKMDWKKSPAGAPVVKAAASVPAGIAHPDAKQQPPEPAKDSKKPAPVVPELASAAMPRLSKNSDRDPFLSLIKPPPPAPPPNALPTDLPRGKRGIFIPQANLEGVAKSGSRMIAVVGGPNKQTYFLYANDAVYNGRVLRITPNSIVFEETVNDPSGKPVTREVVKTLPPAR